MKTAYELQMAAPDDQVVRCKIAMAAILEGKWKDAAAHYRNAAAEGYTSWHKEAGEMSAHCAEKAGQKMSDEERAIAANTAMLPELCYATLACNTPGQRIVIIKRGESGYYGTDLDRPDLSLAQVSQLVVKLNNRLDVSPPQKEAMITGSMLGWHVPGANPSAYARTPEVAG